MVGYRTRSDKTEADFEKLLGSDKGKTIVIYCGFVKSRSYNGAA